MSELVNEHMGKSKEKRRAMLALGLASVSQLSGSPDYCTASDKYLPVSHLRGTDQSYGVQK